MGARGIQRRLIGSRLDTVHKDPCLIYWRHDSRRTNSVLRSTTETGPGAIARDPRAVTSSSGTHPGARKAENAPTGLHQSECEQAEGKETTQEAQARAAWRAAS